VREYWGVKDAFVTSDCGAILNMYSKGGNGYASSPAAAAAYGLSNGTNFNAGIVYGAIEGLEQAVASGLITVQDIDVALRHNLNQRFRVGIFDPLEK